MDARNDKNGDEAFIVVDQSLSGFQGHHYNYSISVFNEANKRGIDAYIFCNQSFQDGLSENRKIIPTFSTAWQNSGTANSEMLRRRVKAITKAMPKWLLKLWLYFVWSMKKFVLFFFRDPEHSGFIQELLLAEKQLPKNVTKTYFFHSIHNDSLAVIVKEKLDDLRHGRVRLNIVLRTDPPTGKSLEKLRKTLTEIWEDELLRKSIALFSDTRQLCDLYNELSPIEFQCLPIPLDLPQWKPGPILLKKVTEKETITLAYIGDARREKGYDLLPKLVDELTERFTGGQLKLIHQCSFPVFGGEPGMADARAALSKWPDTIIRAISAPLSTEAYFELLQSADIVLLPYEIESYGGRSSGVLAEALAFGIPAVVPQNSWMSDQIKDGFGETFIGRDGFIDAVTRAIENWPEQRVNCLANVEEWRAHHSPKSLVDKLI